jgi:hypothetical protein
VGFPCQQGKLRIIPCRCLQELSKNLSQVLGIEPPQPGYSVEVLQWEVPVSPDGRTAILNGTVQQVYKQLVEIDPNYRPEFGIVDNKYLAPRPAQNRESQALREMERHSWSDCGHFDPATTEAVWQGIYHLSHVPGRPVSIPGPGVCGRVSCSYDSAIWWCNDVSY